jgi:uncharacterized protein
VKIHVANVPEDGSRIEFTRDKKWFEEHLPERGRQDMVLESITVSGMVRRLRESVFLEGTLEGALIIACSRCLELTRLPVSSSFRYTFVPTSTGQKEEAELSEDLEFGFYEGETIDLDPVLFEQILLQVPMRTLCRDDCRGLCPRCGMNLNTGSCNCRDEHVDERLAILKSFKVKE